MKSIPTLFTVILLLGSSELAAAQCASDADCKAGRSCLTDTCQRTNSCGKDTDCNGAQICDAGTCADIATASADGATVPAARELDAFPRRTVDQPIVFPDGTLYAAAELQLYADDAGPREITFGDWVALGFKAAYGFRSWQFISWVDLIVHYEPSDVAPLLSQTGLELDRALDQNLIVGAGAFSYYPTEDYGDVGAYAGLLWQRRLDDANVIKLGGGLRHLAGNASFTSTYGWSQWTRQLSAGLALNLRVDIEIFLSGDADPRPSATLEFEYWTSDLRKLFVKLYASEHRGMLSAGVGRVW